MFGIDDILAPVAGGLVKGALDIFGQSQTNDVNAAIAAQNNSANAAQAQLNRDFQQQMSSTSYQRGVQDLQAAGLNPMLAYMNGGASTPSGSVAQMQGYQYRSPVSSAAQGLSEGAGVIGDVVSKMASASQSSATVGQIKATTNKILEETKNVPFQGDQIRYTIQLLSEQAAKAAQEGETQVSIRKQIQATIEQMKIQTKSMKLDVDAAESLDNIGRTSKELKPIVDMVRSFFPSYHFGGSIK